MGAIWQFPSKESSCVRARSVAGVAEQPVTLSLPRCLSPRHPRAASFVVITALLEFIDKALGRRHTRGTPVSASRLSGDVPRGAESRSRHVLWI